MSTDNKTQLAQLSAIPPNSRGRLPSMRRRVQSPVWLQNPFLKDAILQQKLTAQGKTMVSDLVNIFACLISVPEAWSWLLTTNQCHVSQLNHILIRNICIISCFCSQLECQHHYLVKQVFLAIERIFTRFRYSWTSGRCSNFHSPYSMLLWSRLHYRHQHRACADLLVGINWQEIGHGNFSRVFKVLKRIDGCLYAVKRSQHPLRMTSERSYPFPLAVLCEDTSLILLFLISLFFYSNGCLLWTWKLMPLWLIFTRTP